MHKYKDLPSHTPRRTFARSTPALLAAAALALAPLADAATWYLKINQAAGRDWSATYVADWSATADGTGAAPTAISAADTFDLNNHQLRSPGGTANVTFAGGLLQLTGASSVIGLKVGGTATAIVPKLRATAGRVDNWNGGTQYFRADELENAAPAGAYFGLKADSGRTLRVSVGKLTGTGETRVTNSGVIRLELVDAERYTGALHHAAGTLDFDNNLLSSGPLVIDAGAVVALDQSVSFAGLTVDGTEYPPNTYDYATLHAAHPAIFASGVSGASITVRAPRTWYLTTNQAGTQNWTEAYLSNWNSAANGSGTAPASINGYDLYLDQVSNREVRTPGTASTFEGGALALANGAKLTVKTGANVVSTIPAFVNGNSPSIANGSGNFRQNLAVGDWEISSGVTKLSASAGRSLGFAVDYLSGSGGLQTQNGGAFFLSLLDGSAYTGTLDHASGSLRFENNLGTRGALNVGSAATVHLDKFVYFTSATINGVTKSQGFHPYSELNAAHPAQFPTGASTGALAVYTPGAAPVPMRGVNMTGPEGGTSNLPGTVGYDYIYPTAAHFDYYHSKGLNLVRIPFRWERMQHGLNVALDSAQLGYMDTVVGYASARGMKVILDMHNYAECKVGGVKYRFGDTAHLPAGAYADAWRRIADHYKNNTAIYAYDIMNEPHDLGSGVWVSYAQAAIDAIREVDLSHDIIVEGESWANAWGFEAKNPNLHTLRDPLGRLIFSAHSYWSDKGTDVYGTYDAEAAYPEMGMHNVKPFVDWLKKHGFKGFVGEYGVPNDGDSRWITVLENFLAYLSAEGVSGTYWASGQWYNSNLNCIPVNGVDKPQMQALEQYP